MSYSTEQLQAMRQKYVARGVSNGNLNIATKAVNATITTEKGEEFIFQGEADNISDKLIHDSLGVYCLSTA